MKIVNEFSKSIYLRLIVIWLLCFNILGSESKPEPSKYSMLFYGGHFVNSDLLPISLYGDIAYKRSFLGVIGVNRKLDAKIGFLNFEIEGLVGNHQGVMNHFEVDGQFIARIPNLFYLPLSFGLGEGLSWASQNPIMENVRKGFDRGAFSLFNVQSKQLLNFLTLELAYGFPETSNYPRIFVRIHHRSGIWGTYCPPDPPCGSNFLVYGVKISL